MKMIAVGDNVADCYIDDKVFYPGGNAVNVAVNGKRRGFDKVAYIGIFGDDIKAEHIKNCLTREQIDIQLSRTVYAPSGQPRVTINEEGDRVFLPGPRNSAQHLFKLRLTENDLHFISTFDLCHSSCYSSLEDELPNIAEHCDISFDFSEHTDPAYIKKVCPYVKYAFFSGSHLSDQEILELQALCHESGTEVVGVTRGSKGACFSKNGKQYHQAIKEVTVVDTMGAGDSFIAGFLTSYAKGEDMESALNFAAESAAITCTVNGGWGYPHPLED
jgi:fructoselysine 6-kinase